MPRRSQFVRKSPSNKNWTGVIDTNNAIAGSGTAVLLGFLVLSNAGIDETVLRNVGTISVHSDQQSATEVYEGAFGMIVVSNEAAVAGVASVPTPITDIANDGWFVHVPFMSQIRVITAAGFDPVASLQIEFDSKAKRVVQDGSVIALVVESTAASAGITFSVILRGLSMIKGT